MHKADPVHKVSGGRIIGADQSDLRVKNTHRILLVVPVSLFVLSTLLVNAQGPYYTGNYLEDYAYLLNALNLLTFHAPGHTDHPGTTLQVLAAVVVFVKWLLSILFGAWEPLQRAVLSEPESFLHAINLVLNLLISVTAYLAAREVYRISGRLAPAVVLQASLLVFEQTLLAQTRVQNEPLMIVAGLALAVPLVRVMFGSVADAEPSRIPAPAMAGGIFAFGMVSKITFLTLLPLIAAFKKRKERLVFLLSWVVAGFIFIIPALPHLPRMTQWFTSLVVHTGRYGTGEVGVIRTDAFLANLKTLVAIEPVLFLLGCYYIAVLIVLKIQREKEPASAAEIVVLGGCISVVIQILITARQWPARHYLLPSLIVACLVNTALVGLFGSGKLSRRERVAFLSPLVLIGCGGIVYTALRLQTWFWTAAKYRENVRILIGQRQKMTECIKIGYFRSSLPTYALSYGDGYSSGEQRRTLAELYPDAINFNLFNGQFTSFSGPIKLSELKQWIAHGRCVVMEGTAMEKQYSDLLTGLTLEPVFISGPEGIYRLALKTGGEPVELIADPRLPEGAAAVEAEAFSSGNVVVDTAHWGHGIGIVRSETVPTYAEYKITISHGGRYELRIRYASDESRPLRVLLNGSLIARSAASEVTNGYDAKDQFWQKVGIFDFASGQNTLRLESDRPFPHVDKLGLIAVKE
jgi:hypothetical protein